MKQTLKKHEKAKRKYWGEVEELFIPPSMPAFFKRKYWAIHEAAFELSVAWPEYGLCECAITTLPKEMKNERPFFYLPSCKDEFNPEIYGKRFLDIFKGLKRSIENGELAAIFQPICTNVAYLISPSDVVKWAIANEIHLPSALQEATGVYQVSDVEVTKALKEKVRCKILGQYLVMTGRKGSNVSLLCSLVKKIPGIGPMGLSTIRRALNELFMEPGKKGKCRRPFDEKPLPEIIQNKDGVNRYHIPLLLEAMSSLFVHIVSKKGRERVSRMSPEQVFEDFSNRKFVQLYLGDAPQQVLDHISLHCRGICVGMFGYRF